MLTNRVNVMLRAGVLGAALAAGLTGCQAQPKHTVYDTAQVERARFLGYLAYGRQVTDGWKFGEVQSGWAYLDYYSSGLTSLPPWYRYSVRCWADDEVLAELKGKGLIE